MAARVISGESIVVSQAMTWQIVGGTIPPVRQTLQYNLPEAGSPEAPDNRRELEQLAQLAQLNARMALAEAEKDRLIRDARAAGWQEGEAAGRQAAEAEVHSVLERLATSIQQVSELPARLRSDAEADLVQLAVAIAQRILQRELNVDPAVIAGLVRVGLEKVRVQDVVRVRVCPEHLPAIKECLTRMGAAHVEVCADPAQERGGMSFETSRGKLDVSIGTQLREIERGLTDRLRGQG